MNIQWFGIWDENLTLEESKLLGEPPFSEGTLMEETNNIGRAFAIASSVMINGFSWVEDGQKILDIIDLADAELKAHGVRDVQYRRKWVFSFVDYLDGVFGWDAPNMDEQTEDFFYRWMISVRIK